MTTVYEPDVEEGYQWAMPVGSTEPIRQLRYRQRGDPWSPLWMYLISTDIKEGGKPRLVADMPWHGSSVLIVKKRALEVLGPVLGADAEVLPLDCDEEELWLVNPWRVVDALDEERSTVRRFTDGGVMGVDKLVFWPQRVVGLRCFRIPQLPYMLVANEVVAAARAAGLRGTKFRPVWHSPPTP